MLYDDFFSRAYELTQQGVAFATATVVRAEKPTSGKPGDRAIITADGSLSGWIGGSCAQPTVIQEALKALADDECRLIRLSTDGAGQPARDGVIDLPMTCFSGGTMEIYIEPQSPRPRLLIVGTLPVARALAPLAQAMNYHVISLEMDGDALPDANELVPSLGEVGTYLTPATFVVVATHGNYDEAALEHLLKCDVAYIGLVASRRRAESVRDYLRDQGFDEHALARLKAPAGLDIGARRGDEIALSIMAEMVQRRRTDTTPATPQKQHASSPAASARGNANDSNVMFAESPVADDGWGIPENPPRETRAAGVAIDPICHMNVNIATAKYHSHFEGEDYYFCCAGCKRTFDGEPGKYAGRRGVH